VPEAGPRDDDFAALLAESERSAGTEQAVRVGAVVRGRVIEIGAQSAFVAIGAKAEAVIDLAEFRDAETNAVTLSVGDQVEGTIVDDGSRSGAVVLRRTVGRGGHVPGELEQAAAHGIPVEGLVTAQNKGGFDVQIGGVRAFCPASQMDLRRAEPAEYIGKRLRFRVTRIEGGGRNIVVARRGLLEEEAAAAATALWDRLEVGAIVRGRVSSLRDFGAFVDLGGAEGLIHVSELGYGRARHPSEMLTVGQEVEAQVVKLERGDDASRARIGLSLRALAPDPWATATERFPPGTTTTGTVQRLEAFGAFVEIAPGLDGLVHVSKLTLERRVSHPRQVVNPGDTVEVTVVAVDPAKRRLSLSMVERARAAKDKVEESERRETAAAIGTLGQQGRSLGTLGDLLTASRTRPR